MEKLSQAKTAKYFNCSIDTVIRNLKDYGIKAHKQGAWCVSNRVELSEYQRNKLCGALLGDGSLIKCKNGINAQFTYVSKSKQHVEFVCKDFMEYSYKEGIKNMNTLIKEQRSSIYGIRLERLQIKDLLLNIIGGIKMELSIFQKI